MSTTRLGPGGSTTGGALTGAHRQTSYKPPSVAADLPLQTVGVTRGVIEPAGGALQLPLPAGIQAGDIIIVRASIFGTISTGLTLTTPNGFAAFGTAIAYTSSNGATNISTSNVSNWTSKIAVGGDTGPTITWGSTGRGGTWTVVVIRPSSGATATVRATGSNSAATAPTSFSFATTPSGTAGKIQKYFAIGTWVGSGVNTENPVSNTIAPAANETLDSTIPSAIQSTVNAVGPHEFMMGGWANSIMNPSGLITFTDAEAYNYTAFSIEETGGSSEPANEYIIPTVGGASKGPWAQLIASASFSAKALRLICDTREAWAVTNDESFWLDLGVGLTGSEQVVVADVNVKFPTTYSGASWVSTIFDVVLPVSIPAGSRVAVRLLHRAKTSAIRSPYVYATLLD